MEGKLDLSKGIWKELDLSKGIWLNNNEIQITKSIADKQLVFGWASVALLKNGEIPLDWAGDIIPTDELENMAYNFVQFYGQTGEQHKGEAFGKVIESMVFTPEKMQLLGIPENTVHIGWWIGFYIPDPEIFEKVKNGTYKMFSIQGTAKRILI